MGRNIIESLYVNYKNIVIARDLSFDKNSKAYRGKLFRDKHFSAGITIYLMTESNFDCNINIHIITIFRALMRFTTRKCNLITHKI